MLMWRIVKLAGASAVVWLLSGCGGGNGLVDVSGTVSFKGKAVPKGMVWFDPDPGHPGKPPQGFAFIEEGKFESKVKGRGVSKGPYLVRIEGYDGKTANEFPYGKPLASRSIEARMNLEADGKPVTLEMK